MKRSPMLPTLSAGLVVIGALLAQQNSTFAVGHIFMPPHFFKRIIVDNVSFAYGSSLATQVSGRFNPRGSAAICDRETPVVEFNFKGYIAPKFSSYASVVVLPMKSLLRNDSCVKGWVAQDLSRMKSILSTHPRVVSAIDTVGELG